MTAHVLEKDVIFITKRDQKEMPFDISGVRAEKYKDGKELRKVLKKQLEAYGITCF